MSCDDDINYGRVFPSTPYHAHSAYVGYNSFLRKHTQVVHRDLEGPI